MKSEGQNKRLRDAAKGAEETVSERLEACGKLETELRRRTMHVDRKTKEVDLANRKYEKMLASRAPDGHAGMLCPPTTPIHCK
jgi:hypothetical protein